MMLRCLKCGEARRTQANVPKRRPCPSCSGFLVPIKGKQILKVAYQLYRCGFRIHSAESFQYSYSPLNAEKSQPRFEGVWIGICFEHAYKDDVFIKVPSIYKSSLEESGGLQIYFEAKRMQYQSILGTDDGDEVEVVLIEQLYSWAHWLETSGMSSVLLLQGKL